MKKAEARVLLAAVPHPFRGSFLGQTVTELEAIARVIPAAQRLVLPPSDDALLNPRSGLSVATALEKLPEASILHLASHGVQDHWDPLQSGFLLRDDKLSIKRLMPIPLPHAFLAFLSACETAKGDQEYSDQVIHLAATMLFAGFKSVVGTMW
jgi:CHAT domain-containing protein